MSDIKNRLASALLETGAGAAACVSVKALEPRMNERQLARLYRECPGAKTAVMAVFPYFAGLEPGNISIYARGEDYHFVVGKRLFSACEALSSEFAENRFVCFTDASPLPEVYAAAAAGLGSLGANWLLLTPDFGSYVFIGSIVTDIEAGGFAEPKICVRCGLCARACPTGALYREGEGFGFSAGLCLSGLTQKKGELTKSEASAVASAGMAWGCDICQRACPYNAPEGETAIPELRENLITSLSYDDVAGLSDDGLKEKYPRRAFTWRGAEVLRRNLKLTNDGR